MPLFTIDTATFRSHFPGQPFRLEHRLVNHPLFDLARLVELSKSLPAALVEYNSGNVPVSLDPLQTPRTGLSVADTIHRIETCQSWMVLKNVERDPAYGSLLDDCLAEIGALSTPMLGSMGQKDSYIFISSPRSVTPYHIDPEHNFLLQIRGDKQVHLFEAQDRALLSEAELEGFHGGSHRNLKFRDAYEKKAHVFTLKPGEGLHVPVTAPHWVKNGDSVSISFSITFRSEASVRAARLYYINGKLRQFGLSPTPPFKTAWRDNLKYGAYRLAAAAKRALGLRDSVRETGGDQHHDHA